MTVPDVRFIGDGPEHWHILAEWLLVGGVGVPIVLPDNLGVTAAKILFRRSGMSVMRLWKRHYCKRLAQRIGSMTHQNGDSWEFRQRVCDREEESFLNKGRRVSAS